MTTYLIATDDGFTFSPNNQTSMPDIENLQILGFAHGCTAMEALESFNRLNPHISQLGYTNISIYQLKEEGPIYTSL